MNKALVKFYCLFWLILISGYALFGQSEFQVIQSKIDSYLKAEVNNDNLAQAIDTDWLQQRENGSWADIDYTSRRETSWPPLLHLKRINNLALGYVISENKYFGNRQILKGILNGLRYWYSQNPGSDNWFQNDIASPLALGEILILLNNGKSQLPVGLQDSILQLMQQGDVYKSIGANKLDIATHLLYRACITKDEKLMATAVEQSFTPISFTSREGLQYDYAYLQHGPQLQISSYGEVFLKGAYNVASWLQGTVYALSPDKIKILNNYFINTYLKTIRGRYIDFNTEGRGISRNDILDKIVITEKMGKNTLLALAKKVSPENVDLLNAVEQRITEVSDPSYKILSGHTQFWKADYTLHTRLAYSFNVRMVSKRTIRTEEGNGENLVGKFLPDGATNIQRSGAEYFNIMPVWEWDKIPGITSRDYKTDQFTTIKWGERGVKSFVGGVSDSVYGASAYDFDYNEVSAKKAWFYFDKQVVCLGAAINSYAAQNIVTTINQSWQKGEVIAYAGAKLIKVQTGKSIPNASWVWHDSIGYYFPNLGKLQISNQQQNGSWATINSNRSKAVVVGKVFKMWFDHGVDPLNATYAYIVWPGISKKEMKMDKLNEIKILANNSNMQAVKQEELKMIQVVFYEAGTLTDQSISITVDQPCIVLVKHFDTQNPTIHLADPTQQLKEVNITVYSRLTGRGSKALLLLPKGDFAGATVHYLVH